VIVLEIEKKFISCCGNTAGLLASVQSHQLLLSNCCTIKSTTSFKSLARIFFLPATARSPSKWGLIAVHPYQIYDLFQVTCACILGLPATARISQQMGFDRCSSVPNFLWFLGCQRRLGSPSKWGLIAVHPTKSRHHSYSFFYG
jgi:hypothetical protein